MSSYRGVNRTMKASYQSLREHYESFFLVIVGGPAQGRLA